MTSSEMLKYRDGILEAKKRKNNVELANALTLALVRVGLCSSYQHDSWRVVNLPECPLAVQLEFDENHVDIVPLSAYTDKLTVAFPLAAHPVPHHVRLTLNDVQDIDSIVTIISGCFPQHQVDNVKDTKRRVTKRKV